MSPVKTATDDVVSTPEAQYKVYVATAIAASACLALLLPRNRTQITLKMLCKTTSQHSVICIIKYYGLRHATAIFLVHL